MSVSNSLLTIFTLYIVSAAQIQMPPQTNFEPRKMLGLGAACILKIMQDVWYFLYKLIDNQIWRMFIICMENRSAESKNNLFSTIFATSRSKWFVSDADKHADLFPTISRNLLFVHMFTMHL